MSFILIPNWKMVPKDGIKGSTIIVLWFQVPFVEINFVSLFFLFFGGGVGWFQKYITGLVIHSRSKVMSLLSQ